MPESASAQKFVSMAEFAQQPGKETLREHIQHATPLYKTLGLSPDSFKFFDNPGNERVEVHMMPAEVHGGHPGIVHGGVTAFLIDLSAGALAMALAKEGNVAFTTKTEMSFDRIMAMGRDVRCESVHVDAKDDRTIFIKTIVYQKDKNGIEQPIAEGITECNKHAKRCSIVLRVRSS